MARFIRFDLAVIISAFVTVASPSVGHSASFKIESDAGDGSISFIPSMSAQVTGPTVDAARVGVGGAFPDRSNTNAIYFFQLPDISGGALMDAELSFPYVDAENGFSGFDLDAWGIGYVANPTLDVGWLFVGDNDGAVGINTASRQKIQDDLVGAIVDPNDVPVQVKTSATGDANLLAFVQSLYAQGAQAGDYAIIRLNDDRANSDPNAGGTGGYRVGFQEHATLKPELRLFDATVVDWNNAAGGAYGTAGNWSPNNVPDNSPSAETARFDVDATYGVAFGAGTSTTAADLIVSRGQVTFDTTFTGSLANATYNLNGQAILDGGTLELADSASGSDVDVNVANELAINDSGTLQINGGSFTVGGQLTMSSTSNLTLDGGMLNANGGIVVDNALLQSQLGGILSLASGTNLDIRNGGTVSFADTQSFDSANTVTVSNSGTRLEALGGLTISGSSALRLTSVGSEATTSGRDGANGGGGVFNDGGQGNSAGSLQLQSGGLIDVQVGSIFRSDGGQGGDGGNASSPGEGGDGGAAGTWTITGGAMSLEGTATAQGGDGGRGGSGGLSGASGGDGGHGGIINVDGGAVSLVGTLDLNGGNGGNATSFGRRGRGGNGGQVSITSGSFATSGAISLQGGDGGDGGLTGGDGGHGGSISISGGELQFLGGSIDLSGGQGQGSGLNGNDGILSLEGGVLIANALGPNGLELVAGQLNFVSGTLRVTDANGFAVGSNGLISDTLGGDAVVLTANQSLAIDNALSLPARTSLALNGSTVTAGLAVFDSLANLTNSSGSSSLDTPVLALAGSVITVSSGVLSIGDNSVVNGFYSNGIVNVGGNTIDLRDANDAVFDSGAFVDLGNDDGTLIANNGLTLDFGGNITGFGTIDTPNNAATPLINNGNITGNSLAEPITLTGYVKGVGTCDNCNITGTDSPGFSPATVNRGSVSYNGTLEIEIGGTSAGDFDQLNHLLGAGIADLGGTLDVVLIDGFLPSVGDEFEIIAAANVQDTFDTVSLPALSGSLEWLVDYQATSVSLLVGLTGDFDLDGDVDGADFLEWQRSDGTPGGLANWESNYGATAISAVGASVPEPTSILLLVMPLAVVRARR